MNKLKHRVLIPELEAILATPIQETKAFKLGIIDEHGEVIKGAIATKNETNAWSSLDILTNKIRGILKKIPSSHSGLFRRAAGLYVGNMTPDQVSTSADMTAEQIATNIVEYLPSAIDINEDVPANAVGLGNIAGAGIGSSGMPGYKASGYFRGAKVYDVDFDTFYKSRFGKNRYHRYKKYVGEDDIGIDIRNFGRTNPEEGIILHDTKTSLMTYLRFPKKVRVR